ncbi:unnamed protein product, partial [Anisakis simplex]|uniref:Testis-specific protein pbs13-related (inferred by orthology to a S. mansoni protein) n=1 Tax=Anisakis simplex TaxID=6269 RepID=A0A0M3J8T7_ANISI
PIARRSDAESADQFPLWVAGSSPAKFIDRENLMNVSSAFENLALVHEISLNSNFELPSSPTNPIEKAVKECVHRAFWDKIRDDLREDPPEYTSAFQVLMDIKKMIFEVIPEDRVRLRDEVESNLDEKLLKQQIDNGCFEVDRVTTYLVELMSRLCAPVRDEHIKVIFQNVEYFRGTCELLDQTKIDIANFTIKQNRSEIEAYSCLLVLLSSTFIELF